MHKEITSKSNPTFKELKSIYQKNKDLIFIEGEKLFHEAINNNFEITKLLFDKENSNYFLKNIPADNNIEIIYIDNSLLSSLYTTDNKPEDKNLIIAIANRPIYQIQDLFKQKKNLIFLEDIQDPGNLGTIIRSSVAFNIGGICISENSVDPFNTKVIRASAGTIFQIPIVKIPRFIELKKTLEQENYIITGTSVTSGKKITEFNPDCPILLLFGNESKGLSKELLQESKHIIKIPHSKKVESLNLGIAASIIFWEIYCE